MDKLLFLSFGYQAEICYSCLFAIKICSMFSVDFVYFITLKSRHLDFYVSSLKSCNLHTQFSMQRKALRSQFIYVRLTATRQEKTNHKIFRRVILFPALFIEKTRELSLFCGNALRGRLSAIAEKSAILLRSC